MRPTIAAVSTRLQAQGLKIGVSNPHVRRTWSQGAQRCRSRKIRPTKGSPSRAEDITTIIPSDNFGRDSVGKTVNEAVPPPGWATAALYPELMELGSPR